MAGQPYRPSTRSSVTLKSGKRTPARMQQFATAAAAITLDSGACDQEARISGGCSANRCSGSIPTPKIDGSAAFAIDTRLPGMVYAAVKCCPGPQDGLKASTSRDAVKGRPGVIAAVEFKAVPGKTALSDMQNGVAVVADTWYRAKTALDTDAS